MPCPECSQALYFNMADFAPSAPKPAEVGPEPASPSQPQG